MSSKPNYLITTCSISDEDSESEVFLTEDLTEARAKLAELEKGESEDEYHRLYIETHEEDLSLITDTYNGGWNQDAIDDVVNTSKAQYLADSINAWNGVDVKDLLRTLNELRDHLSDSDEREYEYESIDDYIDLSELPGDIPDDLEDCTGYPIWTCDSKGFCLVGQEANEIEHADSIREYYEIEIKK